VRVLRTLESPLANRTARAHAAIKDFYGVTGLTITPRIDLYVFCLVWCCGGLNIFVWCVLMRNVILPKDSASLIWRGDEGNP